MRHHIPPLRRVLQPSTKHPCFLKFEEVRSRAGLNHISKNYYMRPERPLHQTLRTLRTLTVTLDAIPYLPRRPRRPEDVHHQAHASRCPQNLSSPASRRSPSCASLVMAESNSTLVSGRISGCLVFRMLHSDI